MAPGSPPVLNARCPWREAWATRASSGHEPHPADLRRPRRRPPRAALRVRPPHGARRARHHRVRDGVAGRRRVPARAPVLVGHSMGAYVAVLAAASRPELFSRVVLVDGGVPLPVPAGADPDDVLAATLGPALERLRVTYPSADAYVDFFRAHPALGPTWDASVEAYVRYDVLEVEGGVRSRAVDEAVRADGRDLLVTGEELDRALRGLAVPTSLLVAPAGLMGEPPGMLPPAAVAAYDREVPLLEVGTVEDTNHYTILFDPRAAGRVAAAVTGG
ncbi:MAG: alpha/beta hydrolase-fold protein [Nocardioides sp.]